MTRRRGDGAEVSGDEVLGDETTSGKADDAPPDEVTAEGLEDDLAEEGAAQRAPAAVDGGQPRRPGALRRLYRGETSFPFVERRKWWLLISGIVILAGLVSLGFRGLNLGITFKGGTAWTVKAPGVSQSQASSAVQTAGLNQSTVEVLGSGGHEQVRVTADLSALKPAAQQAETTRVIHALADLVHAPDTAVSVTTVGPTWGGQVTNRAIIALIVFLVLVAVYISIRFEPKMAIAAFLALLHDLLVTAGVYSLAGFQVTPDTVIAVLTILGYSLYDTVVVFDRVRDNTKALGSSGRMTYSEMVDLSMNQTLARSINTSLVAIMPVLAVLLIGAELLGASTLQNYGLALVVGLVSGAYSSIFIASPILAWLKEREPRYVALRQRLAAKSERLGRLSPTEAAALLGGRDAGGAKRSGRRAGAPTARPGTLRPGQARGKGGAGRARAGGGAGVPAAAGAGAGAVPAPAAQAQAAPTVAGAGNGKVVVEQSGPNGEPGEDGTPKNGASKARRSPSTAPRASSRRPPPRRKGSKGKKRR